MRDQENRLWQDIQAQGDNLRRVIQHLYSHEHPQLVKAAELFQNELPIALIGIGSAAYLNMPAEIYFGENGRFCSVLNASDSFYRLTAGSQKIQCYYQLSLWRDH
jgi:hypothetical protein